jgi:hypothetical protein
MKWDDFQETTMEISEDWVYDKKKGKMVRLNQKVTKKDNCNLKVTVSDLKLVNHKKPK